MLIQTPVARPRFDRRGRKTSKQSAVQYMALNEPSEEDAKALLDQTLRDPLAGYPETRVPEWFNLLIRRFPLWAFQRFSYLKLQQSGLPTTHPLPLIVESILKDEGLRPDKERSLNPLPTTLDRRRISIAYGFPESWRSSYQLMPGGPCLFREVPDLSNPNFEDMDPPDAPGWYVPPYVETGLELVRLVEARESARDKKGRQEARNALDEFLASVAAKLGKGRPAAGPSVATLKALIAQGRELLQLCWEIFPLDVSDTTQEILAAKDVSDPEAQRLWAARLALPILSLPEILALKDQSGRARTWGKRAERPTPRRLTVWLLAHRLRMHADTVARKALGADASQYFRGKPNPVDAFLP